MSNPAWNVHRERPQASFKVPPLRVPGQSVDEQINALQDKIGEQFLAPFLFVAVSTYGWIQWWTGTRISSIKVTIRNLQLGRDGERLVGQMLEQLRAKGYRVFHDIPGPSFNIDHAIVGPAGIFTIETKSRTKPLIGSCKVLYDGNALQIAGKRAVDQPLRQARAQARWLTTLVNRESTGKYNVRPVLVFPEWYVERIGCRTKDDVWVLNPKALAKFLECEPHILSNASIDFVARILALHCRHTMQDEA